MNNRLRGTLPILACAFALAGCMGGLYSGGRESYPPQNEVPIASNFATSMQPKLQAAEHWRRVAEDAAEALAKGLAAGGKCVPGRGCVPLYLKRACETSGCAPTRCDTTFGRIFHNELLTALVSRGYAVSTAPVPGGLVVEVDSQAVAFTANRAQYRYAGQPVELAPGVWALRDVTSLIGTDNEPASRTGDPDYNWYRARFAAGRTPQNELVVSVSALTAEGTYAARHTGVYYTADADAAHYACAAGSRSAWTIPVTGDCSIGRCVTSSEGKPR
jgi:hypothetical protein